jgi:hypothetical protein
MDDRIRTAETEYATARDTYWAWRSRGAASTLLAGFFARMQAAEERLAALREGMPEPSRADGGAQARYDEARDTYWAWRGAGTGEARLARAFERMHAAAVDLDRVMREAEDRQARDSHT